MIVGYVNAKRGIHAVIVQEGELRHVAFKKIKLLNVPNDLLAPGEVVSIGKKKKEKAS
jgi:hypothetical protein